MFRVDEPRCLHEQAGRADASTIAQLASEREAASMTGHTGGAAIIQARIDAIRYRMQARAAECACTGRND